MADGWPSITVFLGLSTQIVLTACCYRCGARGVPVTRCCPCCSRHKGYDVVVSAQFELFSGDYLR